jgi:MurNAc alpha-1-phosphate uridylyltransferase
VLISDEADLLRETGGGLRHALPLLNASPVVTMNTDAVWHGPNPVQHLLGAWRDDMECLVLLVEKPNIHGHPGKGDFDRAADDRLKRGRDLVYTGLQIIRTDRLAAMTDDVFSMNVVWDAMIRDGGLYGAIYNGQWCDVGQPESIPLAEALCHV